MAMPCTARSLLSILKHRRHHRPRNAVAAVAMLEYFNTELVTGLCASVLTGMGNLEVGSGMYTNDYYNTIWALSKMNFSPGHEWLGQFDFR